MDCSLNGRVGSGRIRRNERLAGEYTHYEEDEGRSGGLRIGYVKIYILDRSKRDA